MNMIISRKIWIASHKKKPKNIRLTDIFKIPSGMKSLEKSA